MSESRRAQIGYKPDGSPRDADRQDRYREVSSWFATLPPVLLFRRSHTYV